MSNHDDDLDRLLSGGSDPGDARLAELLRSLRARGRGTPPAASEALTAFLAAPGPAAVGADPRPSAAAALGASAERPPLVTLGRPHERSTSVMSPIRVPLQSIAKLGLLAKVMLGATLALGGATAVAATGLPADHGNDHVVVTPAADSPSPSAAPTDPSATPDDDATEDANDDATEDANDDATEEANDDANDDATEDATPKAVESEHADNSGHGNATDRADNSGHGNAHDQAGDDDGDDDGAEDQGDDHGQDQNDDQGDDHGGATQAPNPTAGQGGDDNGGDDGGGGSDD
jgi:hypothetical protein